MQFQKLFPFERYTGIHAIRQVKISMRYSFSVLMIILSILTFSGCATPLFQTTYRYEPPIGADGRMCLGKCEQKLVACQKHCAINSEICLKQIEPQADERYAEALKRYDSEMNLYRWQLQQYEFSLMMSRMYVPYWDGRGYYHPYPGPVVFPPYRPAKPKREEIFSKLRAEKCDADCGCQPLYDACFLTCGGKKIPEVKCIANCSKEK